MRSLRGEKSSELHRALGLRTQHGTSIRNKTHKRDGEHDGGWKRAEVGEREKQGRRERKKQQEVKEEGMRAEMDRNRKRRGRKRRGNDRSDRQKEREISAGTVTNKSLQHDKRLLKHFISPQHNGVLLPIICSVSARVDIKWGAAAFSCHFSAVSPSPWRPGCFFWWTWLQAEGRVHAGGAKDGKQQRRKGGQPLTALQAAPGQHCQGPINMQGSWWPASAWGCDFHRCWWLFLHPSALLITLHPPCCNDSNPLLAHSSAAAPPRLLEAVTNQASPRARSRARNFSIPKILTGNWGTMRQGLKPSECASTRKQPASSDPSVNIFQSAHTHCKMLISSWGSPFSVFFSSLGFWKSTGETITV